MLQASLLPMKSLNKTENPMFYLSVMGFCFQRLSFRLLLSINANRNVNQVQNRMANNVDPDKTAPQDLHCLSRHLVWSVGLKKLSCLLYNNDKLVGT